VEATYADSQKRPSTDSLPEEVGVVTPPKVKRARKAKGKAKAEVFTVKIGPPKLTRFEKARIIGARALQISLGAPLFIPVPKNAKDPIEIALCEIEAKSLPVSIRRVLPNGEYQDIPLEYLI